MNCEHMTVADRLERLASRCWHMANQARAKQHDEVNKFATRELLPESEIIRDESFRASYTSGTGKA